MSENKRAKELDLHRPKQKTDRRILRSRDRLGDALIELIQEKPFDSVTVQDVLDRAGVVRSTFYAHYRDKDDLFFSDADEFLEAIANVLTRSQDKSDRVAPVREFFAHVAEGRRLYDALVESGRIHNFFELARGHFARGIEGRLAELPRSGALAPATRPLVAHALAGSLLSLLTWWIDHGMTTPPAEMDALYHDMVWSGVSASAGRVT